MTTYIYGCEPCERAKEVEHPIKACDTFVLFCTQCGKRMGRIPQSCGIKVLFRGGYFPQLEQTPNGKKSEFAHVSSERELYDKASRVGMDVNKVGW